MYPSPIVDIRGHQINPGDRVRFTDTKEVGTVLGLAPEWDGMVDVQVGMGYATMHAYDLEVIDG